MEVKVQTSKGGEVTDDQWEFGTLSGFSCILQQLLERVQPCPEIVLYT